MNLVFPFYQKLNLMKYSKDLVIILPSFGIVEHQKKVPVSKSNTRLQNLFFFLPGHHKPHKLKRFVEWGSLSESTL